MTYDYKLSCTLQALPRPSTTQRQRGPCGDDRRARRNRQARRRRLFRLGRLHQRQDFELVPGRRIVQSWRTTDFADEEPDSTITIELEPTKTGVRLTLLHSGVPDDQTDYENGGWRDFYFAPMKAYFSGEKRKARAPRDDS